MNTVEDFDRLMRSGLKQAVISSGLTCAVLLAGSVAWLAVQGFSVSGLALAGAAVVMALLVLHLVRRAPAPAPRVIDGAIVLRGSRALSGVLTAMSLLLSIAALGLLTSPEARWVTRVSLVVAAVAGLLIAAAGVAMLRRPHVVRVTPDGVGASGVFDGSPSVSWNAVVYVGAPHGLSRGAAAALPLTVSERRNGVTFSTLTRDPTVWALRDWLQHYLDHPDDRDELATGAALERLEAIEARWPSGRLWPRWFAPPRPES